MYQEKDHVLGYVFEMHEFTTRQETPLTTRKPKQTLECITQVTLVRIIPCQQRPLDLTEYYSKLTGVRT